MVTTALPVAELSKDGEHGGNDSIVAFARHYVVDVLIHQLDLPLWEVRVPGARRQAQIAYLNGEHYCSVRPLLERNPSVIHPAVSCSGIFMVCCVYLSWSLPPDPATTGCEF